ADRCTIQLSYAIGVSKPLSVYVDLDGTGKDIDEARLGLLLNEVVDLSPRGIRKHLRLNRPIYVPTSAYGHFGRVPNAALDNFTWEQTDLVDTLRNALNR
ncbi:S-adenosylmethionine synthetase, partial [Gluconobacter japonicus]